MLIKQHKSGQATIVLIVVTMVTVLGVAVASSSQSRINLRDTVYSTQSVQALSCAEAGADRALVDSRVTSDTAIAPAPATINSTDNGGTTYKVDGCDGYTAAINNYPTASPGKVTVLNMPEGNTQEFNITGFSAGNKQIRFKSNTTSNPAIAVYVYSGTVAAPVVTRSMIYCNAGGSGSAPADFTSITSTTSSTTTLDDGTPVDGEICVTNVTIPASPIVMRVRPLYTDQFFQIPSFQGSTGYKVASTGTSGQVQRVVNVTRFYGQLSGSFDEAIVAGESIDDQ
jgi:hypothetical protein